MKEGCSRSSKQQQQEGGGASPCAACKLLRRRCAHHYCVFAPYFPADEPGKFANVHKVFGASNVNKMLQDLPEQRRGDAVSSMVYEANARIRDPVYGCVGAISSLQQQIDALQTQLALTQAEVVHLRVSQNHVMGHNVEEEEEEEEDIASLNNSSRGPTKAIFDMDLVMDQDSFSDSMWSC